MPRKKRCKVFVSYSRHDEELVKPLAGLLGAAANDAVFLDVTSLKPGEVWKSEIETALREAPVFVLCWCCQSQKSEFVGYEIKTAIESGEKRLVPVLFCSAPLPDGVADHQWIDLRGRVVHVCGEHELDKHPAKPALPAPMPMRSPWKWAGIGVAIAVLVAAFFAVLLPRKGSPPAPTVPPVEAPAPTQAPPPPPGAPVSPHHYWPVVVWVIGLAVLFFLWKGIPAVRKRIQQRRAGKIAATAESYFASLGT
jgi:hypothetical protein